VWLGVVLLMLSGVGPLAGQAPVHAVATARILGRVVDRTTGNGLPVARVVIREVGTGSSEGVLWQGLSEHGGYFEVPSIPAGTFDLHVESLAFAPLVYVITLEANASVDLHVEMVPEALALSPLVVTTTRSQRLELGGFFERRSTGLGRTLDRAEIELLSPPRVTDLFHAFAGDQVVPAARGNSADIRLRRGCTPQLVLNGAPFTYPLSLDDLVTVGELEAVEVYHGTTGGALAYSTDPCGTIMVWTRQLGGVTPKPFAGRRLFAAAGIVTVFPIFCP
jgi:hypothetical protein